MKGREFCFCLVLISYQSWTVAFSCSNDLDCDYEGCSGHNAQLPITGAWSLTSSGCDPAHIRAEECQKSAFRCYPRDSGHACAKACGPSNTFGGIYVCTQWCNPPFCMAGTFVRDPGTNLSRCTPCPRGTWTAFSRPAATSCQGPYLSAPKYSIGP
jgi:hypothetical protein